MDRCMCENVSDVFNRMLTKGNISTGDNHCAMRDASWCQYTESFILMFKLECMTLTASVLCFTVKNGFIFQTSVSEVFSKYRTTIVHLNHSAMAKKELMKKTDQSKYSPVFIIT